MIERKDFQLAFPRFSKNITGQELTKAAFQKTPELRTNEDLQIMCQWMRQFPLLGKLGGNQLKSLCRRIACSAFKIGEVVFNQGDMPDAFYLTFSGSLDVEVDGEKVAVLNPGDGFGELALENDSLRGATIRAATNCLLIVVRAHDYKENIKSFQSAKTVAMIKWFAKYVPITTDWSTSRLHKIATVVNMKMFNAGDIVLQQGQPAAEMYFIKSGTAIIQKEIVQEVGNRWPVNCRGWDKISHRFAMPVPLAHISEGNFFGEDNLLGKDERQYTVIATSHLEVVVLNRADAEELFCGKTLYKLNHRNRNLFKTVDEIKSTHDKARNAMKEFVDLKLNAMGPNYYKRLVNAAPQATTPKVMMKLTRTMLEQEQMDKMDIYWQEKLNGEENKHTHSTTTPQETCRLLRRPSHVTNRRMSGKTTLEQLRRKSGHHGLDILHQFGNEQHHHSRFDGHEHDSSHSHAIEQHNRHRHCRKGSHVVDKQGLDYDPHSEGSDPSKLTTSGSLSTLPTRHTPHELNGNVKDHCPNLLKKRMTKHKIIQEKKLKPIGMLQRGSTRKDLRKTMGETKSLGKTDLKDMAKIVIHQHESHVNKVGFEFEHKLRKVSSALL